MKTVSFILEEEDTYSPVGGNSLTLTLQDILAFGLKTLNPVVIGKQTENPFSGGKFIPIPSTNRSSYLHGIRNALQVIKPDIIVSLQSFRLAFRAKSWQPDIPVVLYRHNMVREKSTLSAWLFNRRLRLIDRFIFCSQFIRNHFTDQYPQTASKADVVWNGFKLTEWHPTSQEHRNKEIVLAGRCHPEKGIQEATVAIANVLAKKPDWCGRMILSFTNRFKPLFEDVKSVASRFSGRFIIQEDVPFEEVKKAYEKASICFVPSVGIEAFGRVAVEGHLGGCCVVSSGTGGLKEASGDTAFYLKDTHPSSIEEALLTVIENPQLRRDLAVAGNRRANQLFSIQSTAASFENSLTSTLKGHVSC